MIILPRKVRKQQEYYARLQKLRTLSTVGIAASLPVAAVLNGDGFTACLAGVAAVITLLALNTGQIRRYAPGINSPVFAVRLFSALVYLLGAIAIIGAAALKYQI